jgi:serine/threonine protein kinase
VAYPLSISSPHHHHHHHHHGEEQSKVAERYEVTRPLGEGGFGKAFVVLDKQDFRQYVLKRMDCGSEEEAANAVKEVHAHHTFIDITSYIQIER